MALCLQAGSLGKRIGFRLERDEDGRIVHFTQSRIARGNSIHEGALASDMGCQDVAESLHLTHLPVRWPWG